MVIINFKLSVSHYEMVKCHLKDNNSKTLLYETHKINMLRATLITTLYGDYIYIK